MRRLILSLLVLPLSAIAQSSPFEIGLTGGIHLHSSPHIATPSFFNPTGNLFLRYAFDSTWAAGISANILRGDYLRKKELSPTTDAKFYFASPLVGIQATLTRTLRQKNWRTSLTLKVGYAKSYMKELGTISPTQNPFPLTYPTGSGLSAGLQLEKSKMLTKHIGFIATVGIDYYRLQWEGATPSSFYGANGAFGNFISLPVQMGLTLKP